MAKHGVEEGFWPRRPRQVHPRPLAPRLAALGGTTIAQLWCRLFRGHEVLAVLEEELRARYPRFRFIGWRAFGNIHGSEAREGRAALPVRLHELG